MNLHGASPWYQPKLTHYWRALWLRFAGIGLGDSFALLNEPARGFVGGIQEFGVEHVANLVERLVDV
jgi:hypothetical protein